jgi:predicted phage terminase large subunit-like protein
MHIERFRKSAGGRDESIRTTAREDRARYQNIPYAIRVEQEPGSSGKDAGQAIVRYLDGYDVRSVPVSGDKETRARPFASQAEVGNVRMVVGGWNKAFLDEAIGFPLGKFDDQIDAVSLAYTSLAGSIVGEYGRNPLGGWRGRRSVAQRVR